MSDFNTYLNKSWKDHATNAQAVALTFNQGFELISEAPHVLAFSRLITHVMGEHLGQWQEGIVLLEKLKSHKLCEDLSAVNRSIASLKLSAGVEKPSSFSNSDQAQIYAVSASAMLSQKDLNLAKDYFLTALKMANNLDPKDAANRALAVAGNSLSSGLEEQTNLTSEETELMLLAAQAGRKFWELAGGWLEVERAEYRLAAAYRKAKDLKQSLKHAQLCLEICEKNSASHLDMFFAYEANALTEKELGNSLDFEKARVKMAHFYSLLSEDEKSWCKLLE
jgi:hypothetical protein